MLSQYLNSYKSSSPLVLFRILFGLQMLLSLVRFWANGWIKSTYVDPIFHFKYYGFEWIESLGVYTYVLFFIAIISSIFITIGYKYRISIILFFLTFTYIELIDKVTYLNHYYFISIVSFVMIFLPANSRLSIDSLAKNSPSTKIPAWNIDIIKLLLLMVYFYAGIAKINSDWLINSNPLSIWLPSKFDLPLIGGLLSQYWVASLMSWCGMLFDVFIGFFLFYRKTSHYAYFFVIIFHIMTAILFPSIGMFPFIMITSTTIFLAPRLHDSLINRIETKIKIKPKEKKYIYKSLFGRLSKITLSTVILLQITIPLRYKFYEGDVFWNEEGYRFSWRVMLVEKSGVTNFTVTGDNNKRIMINNEDFLTPFQQKQMSFQPDMILEYAHYLGDHFRSQGHQNIGVYAESYVSLNGRPSQEFIDPKVDLLEQEESFKTKKWIKPFKYEIKGF